MLPIACLRSTKRSQAWVAELRSTFNYISVSLVHAYISEIVRRTYIKFRRMMKNPCELTCLQVVVANCIWTILLCLVGRKILWFLVLSFHHFEIICRQYGQSGQSGQSKDWSCRYSRQGWRGFHQPRLCCSWLQWLLYWWKLQNCLRLLLRCKVLLFPQLLRWHHISWLLS